ncbi:MAG: MBL fold metallo-hydrolase [Ruminococcaceae bacterium]|nr:MBL fold metallo-hydrolase [Oscillospiraceae bacterium]
MLSGCVLIDPIERITENSTETQSFENDGDGKVPDGDENPPLNTQNSNDEKDPTVSTDSSLSIHFIDVGQADAALLICDGKTMLIDGGNVEDSSLVYSYLQKNGVKHLDYVVCTHAHEDHVGGLSGALSYATAGTVFSPVLSYSTKAFSNFVAKVEAQGKSLTVPQAGDSFKLGEADVKILGPLKEYEEVNDTSIVLKVTYGELSFLFTGDMETEAEIDLIESGVDLSATVLKVGHHGSSTSSSYRFLRAVAPTYGVISVGTDNSYGHPHDEILSRYRDADVKLYRTDLQGDIICTSTDGKTLSFTTKKNSDAVTNPTENEKTESDSSAVTEYSYIGNINSKAYHRINCSSLPLEKNRIYFTTQEEAKAAGYTPCSRCAP